MKLHSKFISLFVAICTFSTIGFAQKIAVAADKMNVFYLGVDNPITITATNCPCSKLYVTGTNGTLNGSGCTYTFSVKEVGIAQVTVYEKNGSRLKKLGTSDFRVKMIPLPGLRIGPYGGSYAGAQRVVLAAQQFVRAELYNFDYDARLNVDSFHVSIIRDSAETKTFLNISGKISSEIQNAFSFLKKDDLVVFDHIFVHSDLFSPSAVRAYSKYYDDGTPKDDQPSTAGKDKTKLELEPLTLRIYN